MGLGGNGYYDAVGDRPGGVDPTNRNGWRALAASRALKPAPQTGDARIPLA